jgi:lipopolysaccharide/colanic/teichoic acid biosynthesis glycosyltransferase
VCHLVPSSNPTVELITSAPLTPMLKADQLSTPDVNCIEPAIRNRTDAQAVPVRFPLWKRILDITCVLLALPVLIPVGIVIAAFIKIVSPGPAFYRQPRVGYFGKRLLCLKFRTMKVNADTGVHQTHLKELMTSNRPTRKLDCAGDSRLIAGGAVLRVLGVDELPQLINVLRGEMSLVGPRPCTPYEFDLFAPRHKRRCEAPPGLTGLWQVSGKNRTTFEEMINLDLYYAEHKSLWLDLKIIVLTVPAILALVWEMKVSPKIRAPRIERASEQTQVFERKLPVTPRGTVPAGE